MLKQKLDCEKLKLRCGLELRAVFLSRRARCAELSMTCSSDASNNIFGKIGLCDYYMHGNQATRLKVPQLVAHKWLYTDVSHANRRPLFFWLTDETVRKKNPLSSLLIDILFCCILRKFFKRFNH